MMQNVATACVIPFAQPRGPAAENQAEITMRSAHSERVTIRLTRFAIVLSPGSHLESAIRPKEGDALLANTNPQQLIAMSRFVFVIKLSYLIRVRWRPGLRCRFEIPMLPGNAGSNPGCVNPAFHLTVAAKLNTIFMLQGTGKH
ncbi:hypothetical protein KIL84_008801 [Mauremys mutica]|uniref:Uncharacterized protein n=1 Tax=Mauremys mutica TaxID=74926 RepID=A0A9D4AZR6_9SAUR|nr:hypothetical protein KIL84_008801 [Mauremys mutica]